jgi:hypothetical protein
VGRGEAGRAGRGGAGRGAGRGGAGRGGGGGAGRAAGPSGGGGKIECCIWKRNGIERDAAVEGAVEGRRTG